MGASKVPISSGQKTSSQVSQYQGPTPEEVLMQVRSAALDLTSSGDDLQDDEPLMEAGLDSLAAVEYHGMLTKSFDGISLPSTMMFDMPTVKEISTYITNELKEKLTVVVTESGGDEMVLDEDSSEEDSSEEDSSEDDRRRKKHKKKKKKKPKASKVPISSGQKTSSQVSQYQGPTPEEVLMQVRSAALDLTSSGDDLQDDEPLMEAGLDSLAAVEYHGMLTKSFDGISLPSTMMFDMPTVKEISTYITNELKEKLTVVVTESGGDE